MGVRPTSASRWRQRNVRRPWPLVFADFQATSHPHFGEEAFPLWGPLGLSLLLPVLCIFLHFWPFRGHPLPCLLPWTGINCTSTEASSGARSVRRVTESAHG